MLLDLLVQRVCQEQKVREEQWAPLDQLDTKATRVQWEFQDFKASMGFQVTLASLDPGVHLASMAAMEPSGVLVFLGQMDFLAYPGCRVVLAQKVLKENLFMLKAALKE